MSSYRSLLWLPVALGLMATGEVGASDAPCSAKIQQIQVRGASAYAPFALSDTELPLEIDLGDTKGTCQLAFFLRSLGGSRLEHPGGSLQYQVRDDAGRIIDTGGVTSVPASAVGSPGSLGLRATVRIPGGQAVRPGSYRDRLVVQLTEGGKIIDERPLDLGVRVVRQANIAVAGTAQAGFSGANGASLDFGELTTGKEREVFLFVQSNSAYVMQLRSENGGVMRHTAESSPNGIVSYVASLDGRTMDLSHPVTVPGRGNSAFVQPPYALRARIGEVGGKLAGYYRDMITVDVINVE